MSTVSPLVWDEQLENGDVNIHYKRGRNTWMWRGFLLVIAIPLLLLAVVLLVFGDWASSLAAGALGIFIVITAQSFSPKTITVLANKSIVSKGETIAIDGVFVVGKKENRVHVNVKGNQFHLTPYLSPAIADEIYRLLVLHTIGETTT